MFSHTMTALTGTLIGDAMRQGQIDVFVEMRSPPERGGKHRRVRRLPLCERLADAAVRCAYAWHGPGGRRRAGGGRRTRRSPYKPPRVTATCSPRNCCRCTSLKLMRQPDLAALDAARAEAQMWLAQLPDLTSATDGS